MAHRHDVPASRPRPAIRKARKRECPVLSTQSNVEKIDRMMKAIRQWIRKAEKGALLSKPYYSFYFTGSLSLRALDPLAESAGIIYRISPTPWEDVFRAEIVCMAVKALPPRHEKDDPSPRGNGTQ